tara:strand:- start:40 stop:297 length:258 start_codon:yes stop_codon:yes gene_type:complete
MRDLKEMIKRILQILKKKYKYLKQNTIVCFKDIKEPLTESDFFDAIDLEDIQENVEEEMYSCIPQDVIQKLKDGWDYVRNFFKKL